MTMIVVDSKIYTANRNNQSAEIVASKTCHYPRVSRYQDTFDEINRRVC